MNLELAGFLGAAYLWVKAAHVTFVIFWMAGLFLVPRFYVYHYATSAGSAEDRAWSEREDRARTIILRPAMIAVWLLGLMLAAHLDAWNQGWLMVKLALVVGLTGYQGWITAYGKRLASGKRPMSNRSLRIMNEVPGVAAAVIVVLVIVKPF